MDAFRPALELELRPVEAPSGASEGARVYVLLPSLEMLLGVPAFGSERPICLPHTPRPFNPRAFFAPGRRAAKSLH